MCPWSGHSMDRCCCRPCFGLNTRKTACWLAVSWHNRVKSWWRWQRTRLQAERSRHCFTQTLEKSHAPSCSNDSRACFQTLQWTSMAATLLTDAGPPHPLTPRLLLPRSWWRGRPISRQIFMASLSFATAESTRSSDNLHNGVLHLKPTSGNGKCFPSFLTTVTRLVPVRLERGQWARSAHGHRKVAMMTVTTTTTTTKCHTTKLMTCLPAKTVLLQPQQPRQRQSGRRKKQAPKRKRLFPNPRRKRRKRTWRLCLRPSNRPRALAPKRQRRRKRKRQGRKTNEPRCFWLFVMFLPSLFLSLPLSLLSARALSLFPSLLSALARSVSRALSSRLRSLRLC
eukprot:m.120506 g.120506  ORF g.120506 m.120506 type:complete len:340 (+) comp16503_c0_seq3:1419-2438(+)